MMSSVLVLSMFWQQFGIGCQCNVKGSLVHLHETAAVSYVRDKIINQYFTIMQASSHFGENIFREKTCPRSLCSQYASVLQISFAWHEARKHCQITILHEGAYSTADNSNSSPR